MTAGAIRDTTTVALHRGVFLRDQAHASVREKLWWFGGIKCVPCKGISAKSV